jgi:uncharacterized protein (DUF302 family)
MTVTTASTALGRRCRPWQLSWPYVPITAADHPRQEAAVSQSLVVTESSHNVPSTVDRVRSALAHRPITVFAEIDHAAGARDAGLELPDEVVLVFGNPAIGTTLMQEDPEVGVELPLRLLVWAAPGGTRIGYPDPITLADRYHLPGHLPVLAQLRSLLEQLVTEAVR